MPLLTRRPQDPVRVHRQWRAAVSVLVALLLLVGSILIGGLLVLGRLGGADSSATAVPEGCAVPVRPPTAAPAASSIQVRVFNGTSRKGLAGEVAAQLRQRGFSVTQVGNTARIGIVAKVRHGPTGEVAARAVAAALPAAQLATDARTDASVDLVLGETFDRLRTPEEIAAALAAGPSTTAPGTGGATAPPGC